MRKIKIKYLSHRISGFFSNLIIFIFLSVILLVLETLIGFRYLPPGYIFRFPNIVIFILIPFVVAFIISSLPKKRRRLSKKPKPLSLRTIIIFSVSMGIIIIGALVATVVQDNIDEAKLNSAYERFEVTMHGNISEERKESTLIELESQYQRLDKIYGPIIEERVICVELYPDSDTLRKVNRLTLSFDAYITYVGDEVIIKLPVEQAGSDSRKSNQWASERPGHELTHFFVNEKLGVNKVKMPLWVSEGIAQYQSLKDWKYMYDIFKIKIGLWIFDLVNPEILNNDSFILLSEKYPIDNLDIFYLASFQFMDYLMKECDVNSVLDKIATGDEFNSAIKEETGKETIELYNEWKGYFFKGN